MLEGSVLVWDLVSRDWIVVKPERQGDEIFLKDNDGFPEAFQVRFIFFILPPDLV